MDGTEQSASTVIHHPNGKASSRASKGVMDSAAQEVPELPAKPSAVGAVAAASKLGREAPPQLLAELLTFEGVQIEGKDVLVQVPTAVVGRMIGKNGQVIKDLQTSSGAFINMSKDGEHFRVARISGSFPETHVCALMLIQKFTPREEREKHDRMEGLISQFRALSERPHVMETFSVPVECIGHVLGRGGQLLRDVQDQSHARIEIPRQSIPSEHQRTLQVHGTPEEVQACLQILRDSVAAFRESLQDHPPHHGPMPHAPFEHPDQDRLTEGLYPSPMYPGVPGYSYGYPPYYSPMQYEAPYGYAMQYFMPVPGGYVGVPGDQLSADMTRVSLSPSMDSQDGDHTVPHFSSYGPVGGQFVPGPHGSPLMARSPSMQGSPLLGTHLPHVDSRRHHEAFMAVPAELIGRIIGRQGASVKLLQSETKTRIDVIDADYNTPAGTRYIRISALRPECIQACQNQISARVAAHFSAE